MEKILFLGLGNPILSDDAVGIHVVNEIEHILGDRPGISFLTGSFTGLHMLDAIQGYDTAIIIDAIEGGDAPGTLMRIDLEEMPATSHLTSLHSMDLMTAMKWGRDAGMDMPLRITVYGIHTENVVSFSEHMSQAVEQMVTINAEKIISQECSLSLTK
jgi:hydrogenase maturation protease